MQRALKLVIIGAVAAGTKAASRAKRLNPDLDVTLITRESDISYAGCGLPYFVGGIIKSRSELIVRSPGEFEEAQGIRVMTRHDVESVDASAKSLTVRNLDSGESFCTDYDRLIFATGSVASKPRLPGIDLPGLLQLRNVGDAEGIRQRVEAGAKTAVVVGGGLIGLEAAENLVHQGLSVTILEMQDTILCGFDREVSLWVARYLDEHGVCVRTGETVTGVVGAERAEAVQTKGASYPAELVVWATGTQPNSALAAGAGADIGPFGGISVDSHMHTSLPDVWAAGDCAETTDTARGETTWVAMGSVANKMGRVAGTNAADGGDSAEFRGVVGTSIVKLFGLAVGKTGLTESDAVARGIDFTTVLVPSNDRAHYYPGHRTVFVKLVADRATRALLGAQVWGEGVVDKPLDVMATALSLRATVDDISGLDLAYAPPFAMAIPSAVLAANVLRNKLDGDLYGVGAVELQSLLAKGETVVLDVRTEPEYMIRAIPDSVSIPLEELEARYTELPRDRPIVTVCRVGRRAYLAAIALKRKGFLDVKILDGGTDAYPYDLI